MTTIAFRDGVMATDSLITGNAIRRGAGAKLVRLRDGSLAGFCGGCGLPSVIVPYIEAMIAGETDWTKRPNIPDDQVWGIVARPDGCVLHFASDLALFEVAAPFHAQGSGNEIAMGAMAMGASAIRAVEIACQLDTASGPPVQWASFDNDGRIITESAPVAPASPPSRSE